MYSDDRNSRERLDIGTRHEIDKDMDEHRNAPDLQMEGISDLPDASGLAMLAAVTPAPTEKKKEVISNRKKMVTKWKTKALDACLILVAEGWMADPGDHAGLKSHLVRAKELEKSIDGAVAGRERFVDLTFVYILTFRMQATGRAREACRKADSYS